MAFMSKGISVYSGLNETLDENLNYIDRAKKYGFDNVFTSLHIPEADYSKLISEFTAIVEHSKSMGMDVTADISPKTYKFLGGKENDFKLLKELGISCARVDFGFSPCEIAEFTKNPYGIKIEINGSTVTERFLAEFEKFSPNYENIKACHNYYPRRNTGISLKTFEYKNKLLKKYGMKISAFIPSINNRRGPVFEGLPTLEMHREMNSVVSAKHLFAMGIDNVIFGDPFADESMLQMVGKINEEVINFRINLYTDDEIEKKIIFNKVHIERPDQAEDVIRSTSSRETLGKDSIINPHNNTQRGIGFITVDNKDYLRYAGELEICKKHLPADKRVNIVGKIIDEEIFLMDYIKEEGKFSFEIY